MLKKRGQVTLFIAFAIVIVGFLLILSLRKNGVEDQTLVFPSSFDSVESFVSACVDNAAADAILHIGLEGGYNEIPGLYFASDTGHVPFYLIENRSTVPPLTKIEEETNSAVFSQLMQCFGDFGDFTEEGFNFEYTGIPDVRTVIVTGQVIVKLNLPLAIHYLNATKTFSEFTVQKKVDLHKMHTVAGLLIDHIAKVPDSIPLMYMLDLSDQYGLDIDTVEYNNSIVVYGIRDFLTDPTQEDPALYLFAVFSRNSSTTEVAHS